MKGWSLLSPLSLFALSTSRFVNGAGYFAAVADALMQAKEEIFITDWWCGSRGGHPMGGWGRGRLGGALVSPVGLLSTRRFVTC